jgi:hypothetical protein
MVGAQRPRAAVVVYWYNKSGAFAILPPPSPAHLRAPQAKLSRARRFDLSHPRPRISPPAPGCIPQVSWHPSFLFLLALPLRFINLELALCLVSVVLDPCEIGLKIRFSWSHWPAGRPCA